MRALAFALWLLLAPAPALALDLEGTWHVLVHYTDTASSQPEQPRWHDRVWVFARDGDTLVWTEYPIALFEDEGGRFERIASGSQARVLGSWEPSPEQAGEIRAGLEVNPRGSQVMKLRGSDAEGWSSWHRARADSSAVITFQQTWRVTGLPEQPVFEQLDRLASARTETLEGATRYAVASVEAEGEVLVGAYQRDESRSGSFRMTRSGEVRPLGGRKSRRRGSED